MTPLRIATYNIHKGVQGLGPASRLEIHNLAQAVAHMQADVVCLQEVRGFHRKMQQRFVRWPEQGQADCLKPEGYEAVYRSNAITRHGEHGNAVLSRWPVLASGHHDVSDHRFEQRGLLHVTLQMPLQMPLQVGAVALHLIVVHLGLIHASRKRQVQRLGQFMAQHVPPSAPLVVAGDFNDWGGQLHQPMAALGLHTGAQPVATYPARLPLLPLDRVYVRGLSWCSAHVPPGRAWHRLSDHLPLLVEVAL